MFSNLTFPNNPPIVAEWQPIFLEPIVNSGERITVLIIIKNDRDEISIHRAVDNSVLKFLYGKSSSQIIGLIDYLEKTIKDPLDWVTPFDGVYPGFWSTATDFSNEGILQQALAQSSSLSVKINNTEEMSPKIAIKDGNNWFQDVRTLVTKSNPILAKNFNQEILITKNITYEYNFAYKSFVANLLDFKNLHNQKAQTSIFKMQVLSKNPTVREKQLILQMPTQNDLNMMTLQKKETLIEKVDFFTSFLLEHNVELIKVETADQASQKLLKIAV